MATINGLMQWQEDAQIRPMTRDGQKHDGDCQDTTVTFLAGSGITDSGGNWVMNVADNVCKQVGLVRSVSFVATGTFNPIIDALQPPGIITTGHTASGGYVTLYVRSWDCRCELKPDTPFDYHVAIAYDFVTRT
jgi:hypothetical protein